MADRVPPDRGADTGGLAVRLRGVTKAYSNGVMALGPFDLDVRQGEFVSLLGPQQAVCVGDHTEGYQLSSYRLSVLVHRSFCHHSFRRLPDGS